jgi:hypothetical protein
MRYDKEGMWLRPSEWIPWVMKTHPEWLRDPDGKVHKTDLHLAERAEAKTWRAGRAQGLLARTSPLRAERARRA